MISNLMLMTSAKLFHFSNFEISLPIYQPINLQKATSRIVFTNKSMKLDEINGVTKYLQIYLINLIFQVNSWPKHGAIIGSWSKDYSL